MILGSSARAMGTLNWTPGAPQAPQKRGAEPKARALGIGRGGVRCAPNRDREAPNNPINIFTSNN
jgi:hypothetical protein